MADGLPKRFPLLPPLWRAYDSTETALGSLPVMLLLPTVAALIGAAWAVSHPSLVIRNSLVVHEDSFGSALVAALIGGLVGLLALMGLIFLTTLVWYLLRGDGVWKVQWRFGAEEHLPGAVLRQDGVSLNCMVTPPVGVATPGHVEAIMRLPNGGYRRVPRHGIGEAEDGHRLWFSPGSLGGWTSGVYEVRWYGTTRHRKRFEIARSRFTLR